MEPIIFITGNEGFIGKNIYNFFKNKNYKLEKVCRNDLKLKNNIYLNQKNLNIKKNTFSSEKKFLIHCASSTPQNTKDKFTLWENNINLSLSISEFIISQKIDIVINLSSIDCYGKFIKKNKREILKINENQLLDYFSLYGASKLATETILNLLSEKYNFLNYNLRLPGVVGNSSHINPRNFISFITREIQKGNSLTLNNPDFLFNNIVHTKTICECIETLLYMTNRQITQKRIINIASTQPLKIKELVNIIKNKLSSDSKINYKEENQPSFQINTECAEKFKLPIISTKECLNLFLGSIK